MSVTVASIDDRLTDIAKGSSPDPDSFWESVAYVHGLSIIPENGGYRFQADGCQLAFAKTEGGYHHLTFGTPRFWTYRAEIYSKSASADELINGLFEQALAHISAYQAS